MTIFGLGKAIPEADISQAFVRAISEFACMRLKSNTDKKSFRNELSMPETMRPIASNPSPAQLPPDASFDQRQASYEAYVADMAQKSDGTLFLNHDQSHAEVVLAQIFKTAEDNVKILTGCLKDEVYGTERVSSAAIAYATSRPNACIKILHEHPICTGNRFVDHLAPLMGERLSITKIGPCKVTHFAVADGKHYRVETDKDHHKAFVAFGDDDLGESLSSLFDVIV